jgi:hypothetical protein
MPNLVFFCFQGQIALFILALLGTPTGVADITALGRIAVLFTVFSITFTNVLIPRFTRCQDPARLPTLYLLFVGGTGILLLPIAILAWLFPSPFLWLLGEKYVGLQRECGWVVMAACITQIGAAMSNLNLSKAWIRMQSIAAIPVIVGVQIVAARWLNLRRFHDVILFNTVTAAAPIFLFAIDAFLGMRRGPGSGSRRTNVGSPNISKDDKSAEARFS